MHKITYASKPASTAQSLESYSHSPQYCTLQFNTVNDYYNTNLAAVLARSVGASLVSVVRALDSVHLSRLLGLPLSLVGGSLPELSVSQLHEMAALVDTALKTSEDTLDGLVVVTHEFDGIK